jgi:hypothetical protein
MTIVELPDYAYAGSNKGKKEKVKGYIISASERGKVLELDAGAKIIREIDAPNTYDACRLKNGNILIAYHHGVKIVSPDNQLVFDYKSESEIFACQPIGKNKLLIGECSAGQLLEVNYEGEVLKTIPLTFEQGGHSCFRSARKTKNNHYLVAHYADHTVREYDKNGNLIQEFKRPNPVYGVERLKNGKTVISDRYILSIYNKSGKLIWEFDTKKYPELGVFHLSGFECLPNNEFILCNWLGHQLAEIGVPVFKINLEGEVLWKYTNREKTHSCTNIQVLLK